MKLWAFITAMIQAIIGLSLIYQGISTSMGNVAMLGVIFVGCAIISYIILSVNPARGISRGYDHDPVE